MHVTVKYVNSSIKLVLTDEIFYTYPVSLSIIYGTHLKYWTE